MKDFPRHRKCLLWLGEAYENSLACSRMHIDDDLRWQLASKAKVQAGRIDNYGDTCGVAQRWAGDVAHR